MQATRYETVIEIDANAEYKATRDIVVAIGTVGRTEAKPAIARTEEQPGSPGEESKLIWSAEIGPITVRRATDPKQVKAELAKALRQIASELDAAQL
jgi:hypothetical protein